MVADIPGGTNLYFERPRVKLAYLTPLRLGLAKEAQNPAQFFAAMGSQGAAGGGAGGGGYLYPAAPEYNQFLNEAQAQSQATALGVSPMRAGDSGTGFIDANGNPVLRYHNLLPKRGVMNVNIGGQQVAVGRGETFDTWQPHSGANKLNTKHIHAAQRYTPGIDDAYVKKHYIQGVDTIEQLRAHQRLNAQNLRKGNAFLKGMAQDPEYLKSNYKASKVRPTGAILKAMTGAGRFKTHMRTKVKPMGMMGMMIMAPAIAGAVKGLIDAGKNVPQPKARPKRPTTAFSSEGRARKGLSLTRPNRGQTILRLPNALGTEHGGGEQ